jgi:hypothetical protein
LRVSASSTCWNSSKMRSGRPRRGPRRDR